MNCGSSVCRLKVCGNQSGPGLPFTLRATAARQSFTVMMLSQGNWFSNTWGRSTLSLLPNQNMILNLSDFLKLCWNQLKLRLGCLCNNVAQPSNKHTEFIINYLLIKSHKKTCSWHSHTIKPVFIIPAWQLVKISVSSTHTHQQNTHTVS